MMDIVKGIYKRKDSFFNFFEDESEEDYVDIGVFSRNLRYRANKDAKILF